MTEQKNDHYYGIFTMIFIVMVPIIYFSFFKTQKNLIWDRDGLRQHYNALVYLGQWGREIIENIFQNHKFQVPLWDFHIGYGSDIITPFHYYVIGDPLNLLSVFVPSKHTEYLYSALIILRIYLSGLSFSYYCRQMGKSNSAVLGGAFTYAFCGFILYAGIRHPYFVNPMIYFPLLLAGAEWVFRKKNPALFIFMVFISAISNFYFFYMIVLAVIAYVGIRFFTLSHESILKEAVSVIARFAGFAIVGVSMSAVILCPVLVQFFGTNRLGNKKEIPLLFEPNFYVRFIPSFLTAEHFGTWTILGFAAPALLAVLVLFGTRKKYLRLKITLCVATALLCLPYAGNVFNGFAYVSNRWCWIYAFLICYILVTVWDDMVLLNGASKRFILAASALYALLFVLMQAKAGRIWLFPVILYAVLLAAAFAASRFQAKTRVPKIASGCFLFVTLLHIAANAYNLYSPDMRKYSSRFVTMGTALQQILETPPTALKHIKKTDDSFYRYETNDLEVLNAATIAKENGVQYYWSLENGNISSYLKDMSLRSFVIHNYKDLDHRTFLDALAGVKYYIRKNPCDVPFGFRLNDTIALLPWTVYQVYENQYALPLGYTYDSYIPNETWQDMEDYERQEALMQGLVTDPAQEQEALSHFPKTDLTFSSQIMGYTVSPGKGVKMLPSSSFRIKKKNAKLTLSFTGLKNCETYLSVQGAVIIPDDPIRDDLNITVKSGDSENLMRYMSNRNRNFKNQKNYLINLGYHESPQTEITIKFPAKGTYSFESLKIICQPMDHYSGQIAARKADILENETLDINTVSGTVFLSKDKILCLSIPYSRGWRAWVDGKEQKPIRANGMFMALPLSKGRHEVRLHYRTPGLTAGGLISMAGVIVVYILWKLSLPIFVPEEDEFPLEL